MNLGFIHLPSFAAFACAALPAVLWGARRADALPEEQVRRRMAWLFLLEIPLLLLPAGELLRFGF